MPHSEPIYTRSNCNFAFQLNWGLAVFWRVPIEDSPWLGPLSKAAVPDGIRILDHRFTKPGTSQFLLSTLPEVDPQKVVARVKGRLQYLVRDRWPKAFQRNFAIDSLGSATRAVIEQYVETQLDRYVMAEGDLQAFLKSIQIRRPEVDLSQKRRTARGLFTHNLHLCIRTEGGWGETRRDWLCKVRDRILRIAETRSHLLSRAAVLPDHLHLTLGCPFDAVPADIALCYLNNLAHLYGMKPMYCYSAYLGTFGEYDLGAVGPKEPLPE